MTFRNAATNLSDSMYKQKMFCSEVEVYASEQCVMYNATFLTDSQNKEIHSLTEMNLNCCIFEGRNYSEVACCYSIFDYCQQLSAKSLTWKQRSLLSLTLSLPTPDPLVLNTWGVTHYWVLGIFSQTSWWSQTKLLKNTVCFFKYSSDKYKKKSIVNAAFPQY